MAERGILEQAYGQLIPQGMRPNYAAPRMSVEPTSMVGRGEIRPYTFSWRDMARQWLGSIGMSDNTANAVITLADFTPVGAAFVGNEARRAVGRGERLAPAAEVALAAAPLPMAAKRAASKVVREVAQEVPTVTMRSMDTAAPAINRGPSNVAPVPNWGYETKFSGLRNRPGVDEVEAGFTPTMPLAPQRTIRPEDLQGGVLVAGQADRTRAGGLLESINGRPIPTVTMQGGQDFMRLNEAARTADPNSQGVWASAQGAMEAVGGVVRASDKPHYFAPFTMQGSAGDYSHMMSDTLLGQFQYATKKERKEFDDIMKKQFPDWVGTENLNNLPALREQLMNFPAMRVSMAKTLDAASLQRGLLPDISSSRIVISEPALLNVPTETFGYQIGRLSPEGALIKSPTAPHETYSTQIAGNYLGGLEVPLPVNIAMPDFFEQVMSRPNAKRADVAYNLKRGVRTQNLDQQWVDQASAFLEWAKERGINWNSRGLSSTNP